MTALDLETLELKSGSHDSAERGMCVMEAVAYIANEPFTDHPACACPVISVFLRSYNDSVSNDVRQTLKPFIPRLIGTNSGPAVEERRSLIATDWLVRTYAPAWLRLAGLVTQAHTLASLPIITMKIPPSIREPIEAVRRDAAAAGAAAWATAGDAAGAATRAAAWAAAGDAAGDAAWAAAGAAARAAAWAAAWAAAGAAAWAAAWAAAGDAAWAAAWAASWAALKPAVDELQASVPNLIERMLAAK
jgi:hypothetical protein